MKQLDDIDKKIVRKWYQELQEKKEMLKRIFNERA